MDVDIHTDARFAIANRHHQVRRFSADPRQRDQFLDGVGNRSAINLQKATTNGVNGFGFCPVESDRIDSALDLLERESQHGGRLMRQREEPGTGVSGRLIFGSETEETRYEDAEGVSVRLARHYADDRLLPLPNLALYDSKRSSDLVLAHGGGRTLETLGEMRSTERVERTPTLAYASTTTFDAAVVLRAAWLSS